MLISAKDLQHVNFIDLKSKRGTFLDNKKISDITYKEIPYRRHTIQLGDTSPNIEYNYYTSLVERIRSYFLPSKLTASQI